MDTLKLGRAMIRHVARTTYDENFSKHGHQDALWQARRVGTRFAQETEDDGLKDYLLGQLENFLAELERDNS